MPQFGPISRRDLVRCLRKAGFDGPYAGGRHAFMTKSGLALTIPNPHHKDIGSELLARILRQARLSRSDWEAL
jgi:predicted RNA binding protein YcfA (HicA-like mRNA interferase family)